MSLGDLDVDRCSHTQESVCGAVSRNALGVSPSADLNNQMLLQFFDDLQETHTLPCNRPQLCERSSCDLLNDVIVDTLRLIEYVFAKLAGSTSARSAHEGASGP